MRGYMDIDVRIRGRKHITRRIARPQERSLDNYRDEAAKEL